MTADIMLLACSSLAGLSGGAIGSLLLLRYADSPPVGWLLGVRKPAVVRVGAAAIDAVSPDLPNKANGLPEQASAVGIDQLAADFALHAHAVRRQVTQYADLLADGDAVLRARLRRFEDGGAP